LPKLYGCQIGLPNCWSCSCPRRKQDAAPYKSEKLKNWCTPHKHKYL
jgi:hypothetical protein